MYIPDKIYHATKWENLLSIMATGLEPRNMEHLIYFADSFAGANVFLYLHGVPLNDIIVVEIDTKDLDKDLFDYGGDHNESFFKDIKVYTYPIVISPKHISGYLQIDTDSLDKNLFK